MSLSTNLKVTITAKSDPHSILHSKVLQVLIISVYSFLMYVFQQLIFKFSIYSFVKTASELHAKLHNCAK